MNADEILADIIAEELEIDSSRVVLYDQNFQAPKDPDIYVIISMGPRRVISSKQEFDPDSNSEIKTVILSTTYNVEIASKNEDAKYRNHEIVMALTSNDAKQKMEENNIAIFRTGQIMDLSAIEGRSALHRYRIPVIIQTIEQKEKVIDYFDNFQTVQEEINVP